MKIRLVVAELLHADTRTDMKLTVPVRNFANQPEGASALSFSLQIVSTIHALNSQSRLGVTRYLHPYFF
jgi:hypothetical protein